MTNSKQYSYRNGYFIVGNDENGGAYIGKCSTQVGNYGNGGAYIGKCSG